MRKSSRSPLGRSNILETRSVSPSTRTLGPVKINKSPTMSSGQPKRDLNSNPIRPTRGRGISRISRGSYGGGIRSTANNNDVTDNSNFRTTAKSRLSSNVTRAKFKGSRPLVSGFGNVGAMFQEHTGDELHPQLVKMARKSGQLNLSNKGMKEIPEKVFRINEIDNDEAKQLTLNMSMDGSADDRWWEQNDLSRLYLSSNCLTFVSPEISNLISLQILDLSDNNLVSLPATMGELSNLQRLNLSHNKLESIPCNVYSLPDLRSLQLDHNALTEIPDDIGNLPVLDYLDVSHNKLTTLPRGIGYLQRLSKFNCSDNQITELPEEIGDMFGLTQLDLCQNQLTELPDTIGRLIKLEQLYLRNNRIRILPPLSNCSGLKELHLGNNFITELSEENLTNLSGIKVLDLRENKLESLPDHITVLQALERLDLANNNLSTVPFHMGLLPNLKSMPLEGNPLRLIRRDIVQRGTLQLLKYLRSKVSAPMNTFPGFEEASEGSNSFFEESAIADKYQMRNTQTMAFNEKATEIPQQLLDNGHDAAVKTVDISKNLLTSLPTGLDALQGHVSELVIKNNRLESLPSFLGNFKHLMFIDAAGNRLSTLPWELAQLPHLREINICANKFEEIPECVYAMERLEILFAGDNKIKSINVDGLSKLKYIATLDLHNNDIDHVPYELGNITQIKSLQLEGNPFRVPRTAILAKGTREVLEYLRSRIVPTNNNGD